MEPFDVEIETTYVSTYLGVEHDTVQLIERLQDAINDSEADVGQ